MRPESREEVGEDDVETCVVKNVLQCVFNSSIPAEFGDFLKSILENSRSDDRWIKNQKKERRFTREGEFRTWVFFSF